MPLEETIKICTNELFKEPETVEDVSKSDFKEFLSLATKNLDFIFDRTLYKQIDGVSASSPLCTTLTNAFLVCCKKNWLEHFPLEYRLFYFQRHADETFILLNSPENLKRFQSYLIPRHFNISFTRDNEKYNMSFLDVNIILEQGKTTTSVYCKTSLGDIFTNFDSFLQSTYKIFMIHRLLCKCFWICSDWTKFHFELVKIMYVFKNDGYP